MYQNMVHLENWITSSGPGSLCKNQTFQRFKGTSELNSDLSLNQNRKLRVSVNARALTEKEKLKMMGASSESMKSHHLRTGKAKPVLNPIVENVDFDFVDSDESEVSLDAKKLRHSLNYSTLNFSFDV